MFSESYFVPMCHTLCPFHDHFPVIFPALVHVYNDLRPHTLSFHVTMLD